MPEVAPSPEIPQRAPGPPCDRCGGFVEESRAVQFLEGRLCPACFERTARSVRVWPWGFIIGFGGLINVAFASVLLALSWQRLGASKRARGMWAISAIAVVALVVVMSLPNSRGVGCGLSLALTWFIARDYRPVWRQLKAAGARRAGVVLPIVFAVLAAVALGVGVVLVTEGPDAFKPEP